MKTLILTNIDPDLYRSQSEHRANVNANVLRFILMTFSRKKNNYFDGRVYIWSKKGLTARGWETNAFDGKFKQITQV